MTILRRLLAVYLAVFAIAAVAQQVTSGGASCTGGCVATQNPGVVPPPPLIITTTTIPNGQTTVLYSTTLAATGGTPPYAKWTVLLGTLPPGLSLALTTGILSGTPTQAGNYAFTVQLQDSGGSAQQTTTQPFTVSITTGTSLPVITSACPSAATFGVAYSFTTTATSGVPPYTFAETGALPAGITYPSSGVWTGTPSQAGSFPISITATDSVLSMSAPQACTLLVVYPPLVITSAAPPNGTQGALYSFTFTATGGLAPYSWFTTGTVPPGLGLTGATLSGTPTTAGSYNFCINVNDAQTPPFAAGNCYTVVIAASNSNQIVLPLAQVNPHEFDADRAAPAVTKHILSGGGGDYPWTCAGIQSAVNAWAAAADQAWLVLIDPGDLPSVATSSCIQLTPKLGATHFLILESSSPPTRNQTVCAGANGVNGTRNLGCTSPNDRAHLWHVSDTAVNTNVITTANSSGIPLVDTGGNGPSHIVLRDFEAAPGTVAATTTFNAPVRLGVGSETTAAMLPSHIHVQYFYVHGDAGDTFTVGSAPGFDVLANDFTFNCVYCSIMWGQTDKSIRPGGEGHAIAIANNTGPFRITNNWLEGNSSGVFMGGQTPSIPGIVSASDGEIRANRFTYPAAWIGGWGTGSPSAVRKNASEMKEAARILWDGNIFENVDNTGGQEGPCLGVDTRACSAGTPCDNYAAVIHDITFSNNILRNCLGLQNDARSGGSSAGISVSFGSYNFQFINNLFYNGPGATYCLPATNGLNSCSPYRWPAIGSESSNWTCTASQSGVNGDITLTCADGGTGLHQTDILVGDPVSVQNCTPSTFNTTLGGIGPSGQPKGPPALTGTLFNGLTVVYNNGTSGSGTATGCTLKNNLGYWNNWQWRHNTVVVSSGLSGGTGGIFQSQGPLTNANYARNLVIQDNLWAIDGWSGYTGSGLSEGSSGLNPAESAADLATFTYHHNVVAERNGANYTAYPSGIKGNVAGSNLYFPTTPQCSSTTPTSACVGFKGMLTNTFIQNPADYHDFQLCVTGLGTCAAPSVFAAGQASQASDGTDLGASISAIDAAQVLNTYPGFFPSVGSVIFVSPTGSDANPGSPIAPVATFDKARQLVAGADGSMVDLACGFYPLTASAFVVGDSGTAALPITYVGCATPDATDYKGLDQTILSGGIVLNPANGYTWTTGAQTCGGTCQEYDVSVAASVFGSNQPEALYYNGQRWYRPTSPYQNPNGTGSYYFQSSPDGTHLVTFSALTSSFFPIQGNAPGGNFECYGCYHRDPADTQTSFHGLTSDTCTAPGTTTGVHWVEVMAFERWTGARMRLCNLINDGTNSYALSATQLPVTGITTGAPPNFGPYAGQRYVLDNVKEAFTHPQQFYVDPCVVHPTCSSGVEATWTVSVLVPPGSNPNTDQVVMPVNSTMLTASSATNVTLKNLTISHDAFTIPIAGQPGISDASNVTAANSFQSTGGITLQNVNFAHMQHWAWEFTGVNGTPTAITNSIASTQGWDLGTGLIRIGKSETNTDTAANVTQFVKVSNLWGQGGQRFLPGGVGLCVWIGNAHDNVVTNVTCNDWYSGAYGVGGSQGYYGTFNPGGGGTNHVFAGNNVLSNVVAYDICQGVTSDCGGIHWHSGLSTGNVLSGFLFHDITQDPTSNAFWSGYNGIGVYIDNSSSNIAISNGLVYRASQASFLVNSATDGLGQLNSITNTILAYGKQGCLMKAADTTVLQITFTHLICYGDQWNSHAGPQFEGGSAWIDPTKWSASSNTYFNFQTSLGIGTPWYQTVGGNRTYLSFTGWKALNTGTNDSGSTNTTNPGFVGPSFSAGDNYNFIGSPPTGFTQFATSMFGATLLSQPPSVPQAWTLQLLNKNTGF